MKVLKSEGHLRTLLLEAGKTCQAAGDHSCLQTQVCKFKCSTCHPCCCLRWKSRSKHSLLRKRKAETGTSGMGELQSNTNSFSNFLLVNPLFVSPLTSLCAIAIFCIHFITFLSTPSILRSSFTFKVLGKNGTKKTLKYLQFYESST